MHNFVFGVQAVYELLRMRPDDVVQVIIVKGRTLRNLDRVLELSKRNHISIVQKDKQAFVKWESLNHQGIVAEVRSLTHVSLEEILHRITHRQTPGFLLVLDEITDPHNLGALIRSAACAGTDAVIIPRRGAAQVTPVVVKVSAGGTEHVSLCRVTNVNYTLEKIKQAGFLTVGLSLEARTSLFDLALEGHTALVIGNEERGLRRMVTQNCDQLVKIPMLGQLDSLNASVAGGIALFEVLRQRAPLQPK